MRKVFLKSVPNDGTVDVIELHADVRFVSEDGIRKKFTGIFSVPDDWFVKVYVSRFYGVAPEEITDDDVLDYIDILDDEDTEEIFWDAVDSGCCLSRVSDKRLHSIERFHTLVAQRILGIALILVSMYICVWSDIAYDPVTQGNDGTFLLIAIPLGLAMLLSRNPLSECPYAEEW